MLQPAHPHVYALQLGEMTLTQIYDGSVWHERSHAFFGVNVPDAEFDAVCAANGLPLDGFDFPVTVTLVEVDGRRILIDGGYGTRCGAKAGLMLAGLSSIEVPPETIDTVIISHLHADHIGGLLGEDGAPVFRNAKHLVCTAERDHWAATPASAPCAREAHRVLAALGDHLVTCAAAEEIAPGIRLVGSAGHTPGHLCVEVGDGEHRVLVASDLANHTVWAIEHPDWAMSLDHDPAEAHASRQRLLGRMADENLIMAGTHLPFPALGRIVRSGDVFRYEPLAVL
ncbi:MAG: MBL fold metallo-hydrolase [Devosiaceae bacterium]|nr:MBL fold metallo-hydrolase [Devosiaceae bacterium MH13]